MTQESAPSTGPPDAAPDHPTAQTGEHELMTLERPLDGLSTRAGTQPALDRRERVACNLCGGTRFGVVYRHCPDRLHGFSGDHQLVRCRGCGLGQTNPRMDRESIALAYPPSYGSFTRAEPRGGVVRLVRETARRLYEARWGPSELAPTSPTGDRALDLGTGTGEALAALARAGWQAWGVEPDEQAAGLAARHSGLADDRLLVATAEMAEFPDDSFDLVVASHVIEHLHDPKAVLEKIHGWLDGDGRLILRCPNFGSLERRLFGRWWFALDLPRHLYHFSPATLRRMLEEAGYKVVGSRPQLQGMTLSGSVQHVVNALRSRPGDFRMNRLLYYVLFPLGTVLVLVGWSSYIEFEARPVRRPAS